MIIIIIKYCNRGTVLFQVCGVWGWCGSRFYGRILLLYFASQRVTFTEYIPVFRWSQRRL